MTDASWACSISWVSTPVGPDELGDVALVRQHQLDRHAGEQAKLVEGRQLEGVAGRHPERAVLPLDGDAPLLEDQLGRQGPQDFRLHLDAVEVHDRHRELLADGLQHLAAADPPQPNEHLVEPLAGAVLLGDRVGQLLLGDEPPLQKDTSDPHVRFYRLVRSRLRVIPGIGAVSPRTNGFAAA
jgi:hypothetical protein